MSDSFTNREELRREVREVAEAYAACRAAAALRVMNGPDFAACVERVMVSISRIERAENMPEPLRAELLATLRLLPCQF